MLGALVISAVFILVYNQPSESTQITLAEMNHIPTNVAFKQVMVTRYFEKDGKIRSHRIGMACDARCVVTLYTERGDSVVLNGLDVPRLAHSVQPLSVP